MPVGGCGDEDGVDVAAVEHVPEIDIGPARPIVPFAVDLCVVLVDPKLGALAAVAPDIADREHLDILPRRVPAREIGPGAAQQMPAALRPDADEPHGDALARRDQAVAAQGRRRDNDGNGERRPECTGAAAQKLPSGHGGFVFHGVSLVRLII
jgi:hypothetical protein